VRSSPEEAFAADISRQRAVVYVVRGRPGQNDRPALPAGHPISWGAITDGTVLDCAPYPFPVFVN
jgi:hypothetical protein